MIDTGLDWYHSNIDPQNIWTNPKEIADNGLDDDHNGYIDDILGWDFIDQDNKPWDYDGHGTLIAGIIAGSWKDPNGMAGVNPFARPGDSQARSVIFGYTRASFVAEAIAYAADNGARVINLRVGGKETITTIEQAAVDYAYAKGVVIVVAAGNEAADISQYGIATSDKVLTVAASGLDDQRASFSNWGKIAVTAPGVDILSMRARRTDVMLGIGEGKYAAGSAFVGDDKRHYRASSTSFAAPFVAGLALAWRSPTIPLPHQRAGDEHHQEHRTRCRHARRRSVYRLWHCRCRGGVEGAKGLLPAGRHQSRRGRAEGRRAGGSRPRHRRRQRNEIRRYRDRPGGNAEGMDTGGSGAEERGGDQAWLGDIPAARLKGAKVWQIRVLVEHDNGSKREARFKLTVG